MEANFLKSTPLPLPRNSCDRHLVSKVIELWRPQARRANCSRNLVRSCVSPKYRLLEKVFNLLNTSADIVLCLLGQLVQCL